MILELIIKAVESALDNPKAREQRLLNDLRRRNDAAATLAASTGRVRPGDRPRPPPVPAARPATSPQAPAAAAPRPPAPAGATANSISRWARPQTLRSQFLLTEILKPPLSLREPRDRADGG